MKRPREWPAMRFITRIDTGTVTIATMANCHEMSSIITNVPVMVSTPVSS